MTQQELTEQMLIRVMKPNKIYTRKQLTELFWLEYPVFVAKLLIKSKCATKTPQETLQGILQFSNYKNLKVEHNKYSLVK